MANLNDTMNELNDMANMKDFGKGKPTSKALLEAAKPLIQYMAENWHPHMTCIVDATHAEVFEGQQVVRTEEFLRD